MVDFFWDFVGRGRMMETEGVGGGWRVEGEVLCHGHVYR